MDYVYNNGELYHYGIKGMKWGVRKKNNEPNKKYTDKQRASDRALYGKGGERRINRRMNEGHSISTARQLESDRYRRVAKTKRIAKATAIIAAPIVADMLVNKLSNQTATVSTGKQYVNTYNNKRINDLPKFTANDYYVSPYLSRTTREVVNQHTNKSWSDYAWDEIERAGW